VALDLELTPQLRRLGILRDIVRAVQQARKDAGLDITDRIELHWTVGGAEEPALAVREYSHELAREVLATSINEGRPAHPDDFYEGDDDELGLRFWLQRAALDQQRS
jgi:isoleucyl-tRNA synthetase